jgi:tetrapyrrole methylase family protein/MazG family protein
MHAHDAHLQELTGQTADAILPASLEASKAFSLLYTIIARLRAPDGCPWDRDQTPMSIRNNIIEEAYELVEAISEKDVEHSKEETGDLFLLATMTAYMFEQKSDFSVSSALESVAEKLIRRHPHVFGEDEVQTPSAVIELWNTIKETKEGRRRKDSLIDAVPRHLPPLEKAFKLQKKVSKVGFDWKHRDAVWEKVEEEIRETKQAMLEESAEAQEEEIGDLLFSVVNLSRFSGIDPSIALQRSNEKFSRRFRYVERKMKEAGLELSVEQNQTMNEYWEEAKLHP